MAGGGIFHGFPTPPFAWDLFIHMSDCHEKLEMPGLGLIGYVANSPRTVIGESFSAGRLYDKIGEEADGTVLYVLPNGVLCTLQTGENGDKANR